MAPTSAQRSSLATPTAERASKLLLQQLLDEPADLTRGPPPPTEQEGHLVLRDHLEPVLTVELDRPLSGCPCADEERSCRFGSEVVQQPATDAAPAVCWF